MYQAMVARVRTRPHPNADRIQLADVCEHTVIVGKDVQNDQLGIFFPPEGQLSEEFAEANNLVRRKDEHGNNVGGFFEPNRRVRRQPFRGVKSEGFWMPLSCLDYLEELDKGILTAGLQFDTIAGHEICRKYVTPATRRAMSARDRQARKAHPSFPKHIDTKQLKYEIGDIQPGSLIWPTEKVHGTSGRFGLVYVEEQDTRSWWQRLFGLAKPFRGWQYVNGSRNIVLLDGDPRAFYESEAFRTAAVQPLLDRLHHDEIIYFEIVGYTDTGQAIMPSGSTDKLDKEIQTTYGKTMSWTYGCDQSGMLGPKFHMYVYRIAKCGKDGHYVDLTWPQVRARCYELDLDHVPEIVPIPLFYAGEESKEGLLDLVSDWTVGPSLIDSRHIREGVVLRVEGPFGGPKWLKNKSWEFGVMEGYIKADESHVDLEEVS